MPHQRPFFYKKQGFAKKPPQTERTGGRSDAPADPVIELPGLAQGVAFKIGAELAKRLMRRDVNPKEAFTARDEKGVCWRSSVKALDASGGEAVPYEAMPGAPESRIGLTLACAVLGRQRMLFVAQKATELGVSRIVPLITQFSVQPKDFAHEKAHAWPGQIVRAAKQCRRSSLPSIETPMTLDAFLASPLAEADLKLFLDDVTGEAPPAGEPKSVLLLVGPEGGFSDAERAKLAPAARAWALGGRVLRAETAVLAGLTAVHMRWGDFKQA